MTEGTIVKALAGFYYVDTGDTVYACRARGIFKNEGIKPYVGDHVEIDITHEQDKEAVITAISPRKNSFIRPPVSNVSQFAVIVAAAKPEPNMAVLDKFLVNAEKAHTDIVICVNKTDIDKKGNTGLLRKIYEGIYPVYPVCGKTGEGLDVLRDILKGKRTAFAGPSGAGKSTLINILHPQALAETGVVSHKTSRGRHTTRHVELFTLEDGGEVFDTPGFTSFEAVETDEQELAYLFPEIRALAGRCRFDNCRHMAEPECAVREAVEEGLITKSRYDSYVSQLEEIKARNTY